MNFFIVDKADIQLAMTGISPTTKLMHLSICKQIVGKAFGLEDKALPDDHQACHVHYVGELYKARAYFHVEETAAPRRSRDSSRGHGGGRGGVRDRVRVRDHEHPLARRRGVRHHPAR